MNNSYVRYMIYLENSSFLPSDAINIRKRIRKLTSNFNIIVRDLRIAKKFIECDISLEKKIDIQEILRVLKNIATTIEIIPVVEMKLEKKDSIDIAKRNFNEEKYWWAHEKLEGVWKESQGEEKKLLNGIILVAAAFVHNQKDEREICLSILNRAMNKLYNINGTYFGININILKQKINEIINSKDIYQFKI
ncbi:MAG: DUF309 domain-containing protein [Nitrososphaeraceae archaeon]